MDFSRDYYGTISRYDKKYSFFEFAGIMHRLEFLWNYLICITIEIVSLVLCAFILLSFEGYTGLKIAITCVFLIPCALALYRIWVCRCRRMQDANCSPWYSMIPLFGTPGACLLIRPETIGNMKAERTPSDNKIFANIAKICVIFSLFSYVTNLHKVGCYTISQDYEKKLYLDDKVSLFQKYEEKSGFYYELICLDGKTTYVLVFDDSKSAKKVVSQIKFLSKNYPSTYESDISDDLWEYTDLDKIYVLRNDKVISKFPGDYSFDEILEFYQSNNCDSSLFSFYKIGEPFELKCAEPDSDQLIFYKDCYNGNIERAKNYLLKNKDKINLPLSETDRIRFTKYCIPDVKDFYSYPIILAAKSGNEKLVRYLIENGADVNLSDSFGYTALLILAKTGSAEIIEQLINAGSDVNVISSDKITAVAMAVGGQNPAVLKKLLDAKASVDFDITEREPLMYYARGNMEIIKLLADNGVKTTQVSSNGYNGLLGAVQKNNLEAVIFFLKEGIDPNIKFPEVNSCTVLLHACSEGYTDIVKELVANNSDINQQDEDGRSPLWAASREGYIDIVDFLLHQDNINIESGPDGSSPLMIAANHGHTKIVKLLLENGADINKQYNDGQTALFDAVRNNDKKMIELLLSHGADKTIKDKKGKTAFDD